MFPGFLFPFACSLSTVKCPDTENDFLKCANIFVCLWYYRYLVEIKHRKTNSKIGVIIRLIFGNQGEQSDNAKNHHVLIKTVKELPKLLFLKLNQFNWGIVSDVQKCGNTFFQFCKEFQRCVPLWSATMIKFKNFN